MKKIKTQEELEADISSKISNYGNFKVKLFKKDSTVFQRRSFNDLFLYYRRRGVSELQLMKALKSLKFTARYCDTPHKIVFFKGKNTGRGGIGGNPVKFWWVEYYKDDYYAIYDKDCRNKCGKYTGKYLEKLYDKV